MALGFLDILRSPLGGAGFNLLQGLRGNADFERWLKGEGADYNRYLRESAESLGPIGRTTEMAADAYTRGTGLAAESYRKGTELAAGSYGTATGLAGQLSGQAQRDVNDRFDRLGAESQSLLASRGLATSTVAPSVAYSNEQERGAELRRVNDERLKSLLGVEETFGGRRIDTETTLGGQRIDAESMFSMDQIRANEEAERARRAAQEGRLIFPPRAPNFAQIQPQFKP